MAVAYCYCFTLLMLFLLAAKDPCARLLLGRSTAANLAIAAAGSLGIVSLIQGGALSSAWCYPSLIAPALAIILPILSQRAKAKAPTVRLSKRRQGILDRRLRLVAGASVFALSLVCFVASFSLYSLFGEQSNLWAPESEHITQRFISLSEYAAQHPDKCFILPADDNDDLSETFLDVPNNMMFYGGWSYYAPWRKALEAANGLQSPVYATDLVSQIDKLLFATTNEASAESIRAYLSHLLGREVIATECDQVGPDGMYGHVYRFEA